MARHLLLMVTAVLVLAACQADQPGGDDAAGSQGQQPATVDQAVPSTPDGVTVSGHGSVAGEPDTLRASFGVHVVRDDVETAFDAAAEAADRVLSAVREHGVADEEIQTREFSVRPRQQHRPDQPPAVTGYVVRNLVEVTIRDPDRAGELLAGVADAAGDDGYVEGVHFSLDDDDAQLQAARRQAFEDARRKAEHYAELAGAALGELVSVVELGGQMPPPVPMVDAAADGVEGGAPPILPGEQQVGVQLQATWSFE